MNYFKMKIKFVKMFVKPCPLFLLSLFSLSFLSLPFPIFGIGKIQKKISTNWTNSGHLFLLPLSWPSPPILLLPTSPVVRTIPSPSICSSSARWPAVHEPPPPFKHHPLPPACPSLPLSSSLPPPPLLFLSLSLSSDRKSVV